MYHLAALDESDPTDLTARAAPPSEFSAAFDLYKQAGGSLGGYWTFFSTVSALMLTLTLAGKASIPTRLKIVLGIAYVTFAIVNNVLIYRTQRFTSRAAQHLTRVAARVQSAEYVALLKDGAPGLPWVSSVGQALLTAAVIGGIVLGHIFGPASSEREITLSIPLVGAVASAPAAVVPPQTVTPPLRH